MEKLRREHGLLFETAIEVVLAERGLDVVETEYGKPLGGGLYEFRLRWTAAEVRAKAVASRIRPAAKAEKIMLRVFFCTAGRKIILLLSGYDKGRDSSGRRQDREISRARKAVVSASGSTETCRQAGS